MGLMDAWKAIEWMVNNEGRMLTDSDGVGWKYRAGLWWKEQKPGIYGACRAPYRHGNKDPIMQNQWTQPTTPDPEPRHVLCGTCGKKH